VRAIDLDLGEVFAPSIRALFGDASPSDDLAGYADLDEYALLHQAARWARGEAVAPDGDARPGDGRVSPAVAEGWRGILLRRPRWRAEAEVRAAYEEGGFPTDEVDSLGATEPGRVAIDLATVDARMGDAAASGLLVIEGRDGAVVPLSRAIPRVPGWALIARRYRRLA
jgi:hypothetical protein